MVYRKAVALLLLSFVFCFYACSDKESNAEHTKLTPDSLAHQIDSALVEKQSAPPRPAFHYHFVPRSVWKQKDSFEGAAHKVLLAAINRADIKHLPRLDSFLVPDVYNDSSIADYMHFPPYLPSLAEVDKIIFFSYYNQTFAAYEKGKRILSGPTNMGKRTTPTPTGLYFCNWKSKEIASTVDASWILKWNFNVSNFGGIGFHQYDLPGYPASHSCMRLWASQAEQLYYWADQWKVKEGKLKAKGTPVVIYGAYPFGKPRPWYVLAKEPKSLDIKEETLDSLFAQYKDDIMAAQAERAAYLAQLQSDDSVNIVP